MPYSSPRKRSKTSIEPNTTQNSESSKAFPIHHLLEPKVDPLQIQRFKKQRETASHFNQAEHFIKNVQSNELKDPWKSNYSHHFPSFKRNRTQTTRGYKPSQQYRGITDKEIIRLKIMMKKANRSKDDRLSDENELSPLLPNKTIGTYVRRSQIRDLEQRKEKFLKDVRVQKLQIIKENLKRSRFMEKTVFLSKFVKNRYKDKKNDQEQSLIESKQKNLTRSSFNITLTGWMTDHNVQL